MSRRIRDEMVSAGVPGRARRSASRTASTPAASVPLPRTKRARCAPGSGCRRGTLVVYTGRLLRGKGLEHAARRLRGSRRARIPTCASCSSAPATASRFRSRTSCAGGPRRGPLAGRVVFAGRVDAVEDWLRAADLFVFPSLFEGLGISLVEAAACGLPAIGSRTGGIVDVIDDGRIGPARAAGRRAGAGRRPAASSRSTPAAASQLGQRARHVARERFDAADALARYRALFASLSSRRPSSRPARAPRAGGDPPPSPAARA